MKVWEESTERTTNAWRPKVAAAAALGIVVAGLFAGTPAQAAGGSCNSERQVVSHTGPDGYRVRAYCHSLNAGSYARGVLDIPFALDRATVWFNGLNVWKYSGESTHDGTARTEFKDD
jgi:hypothetical protein